MVQEYEKIWEGVEVAKISRTISHNMILSFLTAIIFEVIIYMLPKVIFIIINTAVTPIILLILLIFHDYIDLDKSDRKLSKLEFMTVLVSILALMISAKGYPLGFGYMYFFPHLCWLFFILFWTSSERFVVVIKFFSTPQKYNATVIDKSFNRVSKHYFLLYWCRPVEQYNKEFRDWNNKWHIL